jgi:hypothetical protein
MKREENYEEYYKLRIIHANTRCISDPDDGCITPEKIKRAFEEDFDTDWDYDEG